MMETRVEQPTVASMNGRILFAFGPDRPGIVRKVTTYLTNRGANIEDSRMTALGGVISMTVLFTCGGNSMGRVVDNIGALSGTGLDYRLFDGGSERGSSENGRPSFSLEVECMDHPGVVNEIVRVLHEQDAHIESLETTMRRGAFCGTPVFHLHAEASVPTCENLGPLRSDIEGLARSEGLDITFCQEAEREGDSPVEQWAC